MGHCVFPDLGSRAGAGSNQLAASTGVAPVSLGSKDQDPRLLDDEAVEIETRGRPCRLTPLRRTARFEAGPRGGGPAYFAKKHTHRRPFRPSESDGLDGRGI
jgi:hypothetical protein